MSAAAERDRALIYRIGGVVALVALGGIALDIVLAMLPGWGPDTVPADAAGWLAQLTSQPVLGLRNLDLLNLAVSVVSLPLYVALFVALWPDAPGLALMRPELDANYERVKADVWEWGRVPEQRG